MSTNQTIATDNDSDVVVVDQYDAEGSKKTIETIAAQKKHWRDQAIDPVTGKKYKELLTELKAKAEAPKEEPKTNLQPEKPQSHTDFDSLVDNLAVLRNLADDEVQELRTEAKNLGIELAQYIKSKGGQAQLKEYRTEKKSKEAIPSPSDRIPVFNGKPANKVFVDPSASAADKQAAFEKYFGPKGANSSQ